MRRASRQLSRAWRFVAQILSGLVLLAALLPPTTAWAYDGLTQATAFPYAAPGPMSSTVTSQGYTWFTTNVVAGRTFNFTASGANSIYFYNASGGYIGGCSCSSYSVYPTSSMAMGIQVYGTAGAALTLSSSDGSSFANAYPLPSGGGLLSESIPASSNAYFVTTLSATTYTLGAGGPTVAGLTVYDSTFTQTAATTGNSLNFTPAAAGTFYIQLSTGATSGSYTLGYGLSYTAPGPQAGSIGSQGFTWYGAILAANRTFNFSAIGAASVNFLDVGGSPLYGGCTTNCSYLPSYSGLFWIKISGTAGTALTLTSTDGSNFANAYPLPSGGGTLPENIPANSSAYFAATLSATTYTLGAGGPSVAGLTVYDSTFTQAAATAGNSLNFTPAAAGTFYIRVGTGANSGRYALGHGLPYTAPGPQAGSIGSQGFTWYGATVTANRTFIFTANGATSISLTDSAGWFARSCTSATCIWTPGSNLLWIQVSGTAGAALTLTSVDGSNFANAYTMPSGGGTLSESIPVSSSAYFVATLSAATYMLGADGPSVTGLTVYNSTLTQVATATGSTLNFTPAAAGTFYVQVSTGASSGYNTTLGYGFPYTAPGPQAGSIGSQGFTWYGASVTANRTFALTANGATGISFTSSQGSAAGSCTAATCSFAPSSSLLWIQIKGTAGTVLTVTSVDGSSFASAYTLPSGGGVLSEAMPASSSAYFVATLSAATYTLGADGPAVAGLTVYNSTYAQVATTAGSSLNFTPTAAGTFYIQVQAGARSGYYALGYGFPFTAPGPQAGSISSQGYTWYAAAVNASRTFQLTASGAASISFTTSAGSIGTSCTAATCGYAPSSSLLWIKVSGTAGASTTLTAADGSSFAMAYPLTSSSIVVMEPPNTTALFRIDNMGTYAYQFSQQVWDPCPSCSGPPQQSYPPNGMTVYNSAQAVVTSTSDNSLTFAPPSTGTYYVSMNTAVSSCMYDSCQSAPTQNYQFTVASSAGATPSTAIPYTAPGPLLGIITSSGYTWYSASLAANRTFGFTAKGATAIAFYDSTGSTQQARCSVSTCSFIPATTAKYTIQVTGSPGASTSLTSQDGSAINSAYPLTLTNNSGTATNSQPASSTTYYQVALAANAPYTFAGSGPSTPTQVAIYDGSQNLLGNSGGQVSMNFTPAATTSYYLALTAGATAGQYTMKVYPQVTGTLSVAAGGTAGPGGTLQLSVTSSTAATWTGVDYKLSTDSTWTNHQIGSGSLSAGAATVPWTVPSTAGTWLIRVDLADASGNSGFTSTLTLVLEAQPTATAASNLDNVSLTLPALPDANATYTIVRSTSSSFANGTTTQIVSGSTATAATDGTNHIANSNFGLSVASDGTPANWTKLGTAATYTLETGNPTPGGTALHVSRTVTTGQDGVIQTIFTGSGLIGHQLTLSGWLRTSNVSTGSGSGAWLELRFFQQDGTLLGSQPTTALTGTNSWQRYSTTATVPANTYVIKVAVVLNLASGDLWAGGIQAEPGFQMSNYSPDILQDGVTYYYQVTVWNGPLSSQPIVIPVTYHDLPDALGHWNKGAQ